MPGQHFRDGGYANQQADFDVARLRGFGEVGGGHERQPPIHYDTLGVQAGAAGGAGSSISASSSASMSPQWSWLALRSARSPVGYQRLGA